MAVTNPKRLTKAKKAEIPRPANSFILFRGSLSRAINAKDKQKAVSRVSKKASELWKALPAEERAKWDEEAEMVKKQHALDHPDYKFQPRKRKDTNSGGTEPSPAKWRKKGGKAAQKATSEIPASPDISTTVCGRHFIVSVAEVDDSGALIRDMSSLVIGVLTELVTLSPRLGMENQDRAASSEGAVDSGQSSLQSIEPSTPAVPVSPRSGTTDQSKNTPDSEHSQPPGYHNVQLSLPPSGFDQSKVTLDSLTWLERVEQSTHSPPLADPAPRKNSAPTLSPAVVQEPSTKQRPRSISKADVYPPQSVIRHGPGLTGVYGENV